jgi:RNA polymerase sigma factor (sigma-70 family)
LSTSAQSGSQETTSPGGQPGPRAVFATTHWSAVVTAGGNNSARAFEAMSELCRTYWMPLYAYVRRRGYSPEDAKDLTQEFFARLLERNAVATVDRQKGKFRTFLLASISHFLADEWDKARAQKRGGGLVIPLDTGSAETRFLQHAACGLSSEQVFEQRWALAVLEEVYQRLRREFERAGKDEWFQGLRFALMGERSTVPYAELARQFATSESAIKVAVHRLRQRYRDLLRETIAGTVADPGEIEEELRYLLRTLAGG